MRQSAITFLKGTDAMDQTGRVTASETHAGFLIMETLQFHILYELSTYHSEYSLFDQAKNIPAYP